MDDQQTEPTRDLTARLRDVAQYSFDREIDRLRMTKQERAAIACAVAFLAPVSNYDSLTQDTLRNLLERTA